MSDRISRPFKKKNNIIVLGRTNTLTLLLKVLKIKEAFTKAKRKRTSYRRQEADLNVLI